MERNQQKWSTGNHTIEVIHKTSRDFSEMTSDQDGVALTSQGYTPLEVALTSQGYTDL